MNRSGQVSRLTCADIYDTRLTMNTYTYKNDVLHAEEIPLDLLAEKYGTPLYVYSRNALLERFSALSAAMNEVNPLICFSVKANSNAAVLKTFSAQGGGFDVVSGGELFRALRSGADPQKIVFAGVGKNVEEIEYAINSNILFFTVESEPEVMRISECATRLDKMARIAFRINPDVDPKTHKYTTTGKKENKFGLDIERTHKAYELAAGLPGIEITGLHMHIGSQILDFQPFADALERVKKLCIELKEKYPTFQYVDIGGGIGIRYKQEQPEPDPQAFAAQVIPALQEIGLKTVMEPGRFLAGNAGILLTRVQYIKENPFKKFVIVDAAMNDLLRPSLYQAHHDILAVKNTSDSFIGDVVGPICESGDFLAQERKLPAVHQNDLLAIMSAGAYGFSMASNYNSRRRAAEVMVDNDRHRLIHKRETWEDLVRGEIDRD